ncbi:AI-2E family transporter [Microbacterium sp. NPDC019599]|uniref:AI-2E family transporter n=1 Tax=Microbacterium sp. NPDC019599 TaxID=3154690 RepID=UPI0033E67B85
MTDDLAPSQPASAAAVPANSAQDVAVPDVIVDQPRREIWTNVGRPFATGLTLTIGGLVALALGVAFMNLSTIVIYIVLALFVALALDPVVHRLSRRLMSRTWAIVTVYSVFAILLIVFLSAVLPALFSNLSAFIASIPSLIDNFQASDFYAWLQDTFGAQVGTILEQLEDFITNPANLAAIGSGVLKVGVGIATAISGGIIVIVLSLYFLAGLPVMKDTLAQMTPAYGRKTVRGMTEEITGSIGGYLTGMVILAFCNSVVAFLLHFFLNLPYPGLMALAAFCITLIPLIGSVCYWIFATTIALFTDPTAALIFAIVYLIYMQIEAYFLTPKVMNKTISVPGALVVIGAMVGGTLMGLLGALVAIPITASILLIIKRVFIPRQDAKVVAPR